MQWGKTWGSAWGSLVACPFGPGCAAEAIIQRAENTILTIWNAWWSSSAFAPEAWTLTAAGGIAAPVVVLVEAVADPPTELLLTVDQPLLDGVTYELDTTADIGGIVPDPVSFVGKPITLTLQPDLDFLDVDANPFEPYRYTPGGDHGMAVGFATFRKMVIDRCLTVRGSVPWDLDHGSELPHKQARPLDLTTESARLVRLLSTVPGMLSVGADLRWDGRQLVVDLDCRGEAGAIAETVRI